MVYMGQVSLPRCLKDMTYIRAILISALLSAVPLGGNAQPSLVDFETTITVTDGVRSTGLTIGMREDALSGTDTYDQLAPPPPPSAAFDARLIGPDNEYFTDVRPLVETPTDFEVAYQASAGNGPVELQWDPDALAEFGTFVIVDRFGTGSVSIDMTDVGSLDTSTEPLLEDGLVVRATARHSDPIPVELSSFDALFDAGAVVLTWRTQSETDNAGFAVEQRGEGEAFRQAGFVEGAGTTSQPQNYRFRIDGLLPGPYDFRLRQVDHDGAASYSAPVTVRVETEQAYWLEGPTPHPVQSRSQFGLAVEQSQHVSVEVVDLLGRTVHTYAAEMAAHRTHQFDLNAEQLRLSSGTYVLRVRGETFVATERIAVVR